MAENEKPGDKGGKRSGRPRTAEAGATRSPRPPKASKAKPAGNGAAKSPAVGGKAGAAAPEQKARHWFEAIRKYLKSVRSEFKNIKWPTRQELRAMTIVVVATLIVVTFYLYVVDLVFAQLFTRLGGG